MRPWVGFWVVLNCKDWQFFVAEAFNWLNHPNWGGVDTNPNNLTTTFGIERSIAQYNLIQCLVFLLDLAIAQDAGFIFGKVITYKVGVTFLYGDPVAGFNGCRVTGAFFLFLHFGVELFFALEDIATLAARRILGLALGGLAQLASERARLRRADAVAGAPLDEREREGPDDLRRPRPAGVRHARVADRGAPLVERADARAVLPVAVVRGLVPGQERSAGEAQRREGLVDLDHAGGTRRDGRGAGRALGTLLTLRAFAGRQRDGRQCEWQHATDTTGDGANGGGGGGR